MSRRNYGIELFRSVSMILIIIVHIMGNGGVLDYASIAPRGTFFAAWGMEIIGLCCVNCFAIITGYVNIGSKFKFRRVINMWLEVFFWLAFTTLVYKLINPEYVVTISPLLEMTFMPVTFNAYWYFNAYLILFPFIPILGEGLKKLSKRQYRLVLLLLFVPLSVFQFISGTDVFVTQNGQSAIWLIAMFVLGGYFRLHGIPKFAGPVKMLITFFVSAGLTWVIKCHSLDLINAGLIDMGGEINVRIGRITTYLSPTIILMSVSLLLFFAQLKFRHKTAEKIIAALGKHSFGVYLIHVSPVVWNELIFYKFTFIAKMSPVMLILTVLGLSVGFYIILDLLSMGRFYLFKLCRIGTIVDKAADKIKSKFSKEKNLQE